MRATSLIVTSLALLGSLWATGCRIAQADPTDEKPSAKVTELSADLEMPDFHDSTKLEGPLKVGVPVTLNFKNNATVTVVPEKISKDVIRLSTELVRNGGAVLYNATFFTHYNVDADLSEKNPKGDLIYRLKLDPRVATQQ